MIKRLFVVMLLFVLVPFCLGAKKSVRSNALVNNGECPTGQICQGDGGTTQDTTKPIITLSNNIPTVVEVHTIIDWSSYATAYDKKDGNITHRLTFTTNYNRSVLGRYYVRYQVSDLGGNTTVVFHYVNVVDTTRPKFIISNSIPYNIDRSVTSLDLSPYVTAFDNYDGDVTHKIDITYTIQYGVRGKYPVYFEVKDNAGNYSLYTHYIIIE